MKEKIQKINCILGDNKIFMILEKEKYSYMIIGIFIDNNLFITDFMIDLAYKENIHILLNMVKLKGINLFIII